jgi:hypothetical protein
VSSVVETNLEPNLSAVETVIKVESNLVQEPVNRSARDLIKANDPGKQDLLSGLDLRVLSRDQLESLRDLICGIKYRGSIVIITIIL